MKVFKNPIPVAGWYEIFGKDPIPVPGWYEFWKQTSNTSWYPQKCIKSGYPPVTG
jgi:hypothetical protein